VIVQNHSQGGYKRLVSDVVSRAGCSISSCGECSCGCFLLDLPMHLISFLIKQISQLGQY